MVVAITKHNVKWLSPSPVWGRFREFKDQADRDLFAQPNILRFNNDNFMDELLSAMTYYPDKLSEWKARKETWRQPMATPKTAAKLILNEPLSDLNKTQKRQIEKRIQEQTVSTQNTSEPESSHQLPPLEAEPLKLYQPAQQRYYLVSASLVCQKRGLPDRIVDVGRQEQVSFLLRRLSLKKVADLPLNNETQDSEKTLLEFLADEKNVKNCDEYALVQTENGVQWKNFTDSNYSVNQAMPDEERLPMFTIGFSDLDNRNRRLLAGLIPVAKREAYINAAESITASLQPGQSIDNANKEKLLEQKKAALKSLFEMEVAGPWKAMIEQVYIERGQRGDTNKTDINALFDDAGPDPVTGVERFREVIKTSREQIQTISWYVLVDFAKFLHDYIHNVWEKLNDDQFDLTEDNEILLYQTIKGITLSDNLRGALIENGSYGSTDVKDDMAQALSAVIKTDELVDDLEKIDLTYDRENLPSYAVDDPRWPEFLFPLADPVVAGPLPDLNLPNESTAVGDEDISLAILDKFSERVINTISVAPGEAPEVISFTPPPVDSTLNSREAVFVIRCIYEQPNCGPFNPAVLSAPTEPFQMASFFDSDAPGRPIQIPMPIDISPAGLRKFNKNTTFMISDMLCGKLNSIRKLTFGDLVLSVLPWPFHKDLPEPTGPASCGGSNPFGMFCSLSIPIVTICAFVLLIIMVALFDLFFRWIPLLFVCLPIPGFKGKK